MTGVGFGRFGDAIDRQRAAGDIPDSLKIEYRQVHSEYLTAFAEAGVIVRDLPGRGLVRASVGWWTSDDDLERLVAAL